MRTVDDAFQFLDYLDQCGLVADLIEGRSLQLGQQGADLLLGKAVEDSCSATEAALDE